RPTLRIARGRDDAGGLAEQYVCAPLALEELSVDVDAVALRHECVQLPGLAVDRHPPGLDQFVGLSPRGDPGSGEVGVQAHRRIFTGGTVPARQRAARHHPRRAALRVADAL